MNMKQLLALVLSFQLICVPVVGAAASQNNETQKEQQELNDPSKNAQTDTGTNAAYDARSQGGGGYANFSKQILGASTAIIGSNIISSCKWGAKVPSILAFMGGAIAYLISEVSGGKKQNEEHKQRLERVEQIKKQVAENKGGGDVQRVLIEQRLEEEEKILAFVKERNKWGMAIMAIYTIAAALAVYEEMSGMAAGTAIGMSTCASLAAQYAAPCGKKYPACYAKHMAACTPVQPLGQTTAKAAFMSPTSLPTGQATCTGPYVTACLANLKAYAAIAYANCQPLGAGNFSATVAGKSFTVNLYSAAFGLGMGYASAGNLQTLLQLAVSLTGLFTKALATKITALYSYPIPRSVTFGAHAALMGVIIAGLKGVESQTEENIEKLRKVVTQFREHTDDQSGMNKGQVPLAPELGDYKGKEFGPSASGTQSLAQNPRPLNKKELTIAKSRTCLSNADNELNIGQAACNKAASIQPITVSIKQSRNQSLESGVQHLNELNRSLSEGNMDAASSSAAELASMALSLKKDLELAQNEYNKKLPKEDQVDFTAEIDKQLNELQVSPEAQKIYDDFEKQQGIKLASFGAGHHASLDSLDDGSDSEIAAQENLEQKSIVLNNGVSDINEAALAAQELLQQGILQEDSSAIDESGLLYGGDKTSNNPFGLNEDAYRAASANGYLHLHGKNGYSALEGVASRKENIFKIISNRYFLSYPKVMDRKTVDAQRTE